MGLRGEPGRTGETGKMGPMVRRTREKAETRSHIHELNTTNNTLVNHNM
jgi:hypothetical protein